MYMYIYIYVYIYTTNTYHHILAIWPNLWSLQLPNKKPGDCWGPSTAEPEIAETTHGGA